MGELGQAAADLLLGACCPGCGVAGWGACNRCRAHVIGQPVRLTAPTPAPRDFPVTATASSYDSVLRSLLHAHKEEQALMLTALLGDRLAAAVAMLLQARDWPDQAPLVLVPMPSAAAAVRARGIDATAILAQRAARTLAARRPVRSSSLLAQRRGLADQSRLDATQRSQNLSGGLRLRRSRLIASRPSRQAAIVLVDDLVTTGATLAEANRSVREAGLPVLGAATVSATVRRLSGY